MSSSLQILSDPHATTGAKMMALRDLQKRPASERKTTDAIARCLLTAPEDLRAALLRALQQRSASATYQRALNEDDPVFAAKVLRALGDQSSAPALAALVASSANDAARAAAAHALAVLGCKDPGPLFVALGDADAQVRFFVVIALGNAPRSTEIAQALRARHAVETDPVVASEIARVLRGL